MLRWVIWRLKLNTLPSDDIKNPVNDWVFYFALTMTASEFAFQYAIQ
ncbi:hypothetical protein ENHAE0001_2524 [Enhydrobacter aerosaccus SK60]|nr:hypothetical protein ENHAE0001_2524 [Enhydrobacter aerosaccus SK60]